MNSSSQRCIIYFYSSFIFHLRFTKQNYYIKSVIVQMNWHWRYQTDHLLVFLFVNSDYYPMASNWREAKQPAIFIKRRPLATILIKTLVSNSKPNYHDGIGVFALNFVILSHYRVDFFYITWYSQRDAIKEILLNINMDSVSCFPLKPMTGTWLICLPNVDQSLATHKLTRSCIPQLAELLTRSEPNVTDYWFNSENQQITYSL